MLLLELTELLPPALADALPPALALLLELLLELVELLTLDPPLALALLEPPADALDPPPQLHQGKNMNPANTTGNADRITGDWINFFIALLFVRKNGEFRRYAAFGTLAPASRASESPMAIACFRLVTFLWLRPLLNLPSLNSCITLPTFCWACSLYFRFATPHHLQSSNADLLLPYTQP